MRSTRHWPWWIAAGTVLIVIGITARQENRP